MGWAMNEATRFLLVEDNPGYARVVKLVLSQLPSPQPQIDHVETLAAALARLRTAPVDLILTDLNLPDSDGLDTCRALVAAGPDSAVVVLTGSDEHDQGIAAISAG